MMLKSGARGGGNMTHQSRSEMMMCDSVEVLFCCLSGRYDWE